MKHQPRALLVRILLVGSLFAAVGCSVSGTPAPPRATAAPMAATPSAATPSQVTPSMTPTTATPKQGTPTTAASQEDPPLVFAVVGDYGRDNGHAAAVAELVASWNPAFVLSVGDGYYAPAGGTGSARYDESTGAYFCGWLAGITTTGKRCPAGLAEQNAFFPAMGNHDYTDARPSPETYLSYFDLPGAGFTNSSGNERFYDFVQGPVHFFVLDSNPQQPAGTTETSRQARWLKQQLAASTSTWNVVYDHHPPYSSDDDHGSSLGMRWPFAEWGADAVISGHSHTYERVMQDGIVYFVNGLGGSPVHKFTTPVAGSAVRYNNNWGAQQVSATATSLTFVFVNVDGAVIDSISLPAK